MLSFVLAAVIAFPADANAVALDTTPLTGAAVRRAMPPQDSVRRRRTVELSDWYYRRLEVHRWGSYAELPLFAAEYLLGDRLMDQSRPVPSWVKPTHVGVAATLGGLFAVNTVTGTWNLVEGWSQLGDRRKLIVAHSVMMLAADAGFAAAPLLVDDDRGSEGQRTHRTVAVASMSVAALSTVVMWVAKNK